MRDTRHVHRKEEIEGACVRMLQANAGEVYRSVCVGKELWRLWENDLKKKKMNVRDGQKAEGGGGRGGRVHA